MPTDSAGAAMFGIAFVRTFHPRHDRVPWWADADLPTYDLRAHAHMVCTVLAAQISEVSRESGQTTSSLVGPDEIFSFSS